MNATTLIAIQFISLIIMIGTAEELFTTIYPTMLFAGSFIAFALCSIYISNNKKWLLRENEQKSNVL